MTSSVIPGLVPGIQRAPYSVVKLREPSCAAIGFTFSPASRGEPSTSAVTNGIILRVEQHRAGSGSSFTRKYKVHRLVWFQEFSAVREAIQREKTMKEWPRAWKVNLIEEINPHWVDLYHSLPGVQRAVIKGVR